MWQWIIQRPGFDSSSRMSVVDAAGSRTVSFHARLWFGTPFCDRTRKRWP